jgi:hypothetical protein
MELWMSEAVPDGFLRFSEAVALLALGMWGGLTRSEPVRELKRQYRTPAFGPWKERAGQHLTLAALNEQIPIYVFGRPQVEAGRPRPEMTQVPGAVLGRLIKIRSSFPDHPRASMKAVGGNGELYRALNTGVLIVRTSDFDAWYRRERQKGRWPSQRSRLKKEGRPSRQTDELRNAVTAIVREGKISIAELRRRLIASGRTDIPSEDTLARAVDQLYRETGEAIFRRPKRARRK